MNFRYKVLEKCIKAVNIKRIYNMPEKEMFDYLKANHRAADLPDFLYRNLEVEKRDFNRQPLFKLQPKNGGTDKTILFIHGGGGMMCPTLLHYRFAEKLVKNTGAVLYFPFYPLGPEASIKESMRWIDGVYEEILKNHNNITIIGDSAGAVLSVSLCRRNAVKPKGLVLISPSAGINKTDGKMQAIEEKDIILSVRTIELVKKYWIKDEEISDGDFNTLKDDYGGFPPVQLYYGTNELFYPYIGELTDKIKNAGVETEVIEGVGLCHDWALIGIIPEGKMAVEKICEFVKK